VLHWRVAGDPAGPPGRRVSRLWRWLIPLAVLPCSPCWRTGFAQTARIPSPLVGRPAPAFALATLDGAPLSLERTRKVVS